MSVRNDTIALVIARGHHRHGLIGKYVRTLFSGLIDEYRLALTDYEIMFANLLDGKILLTNNNK